MISVESMSPTTINTVWAGRRIAFLRPMRMRSMLRTPIHTMTARAAPSRISSATMMLLRGTPKRLSNANTLVHAFALDAAIVHVNRAMAARGNARVVRHDHERQTLLAVELLHQR